MKDFNKIEFIDKNLHEVKKGISIDYTGVFEMVGGTSVGDHIRQTRIIKITDSEQYINAFDQDYESEDTVSNGYIYKLNKSQFNLVKRIRYGNGCDFKQQINENFGSI